MARSAGGSTGAAPTPSSTNSEGETHVSVARRGAHERGARDERRASRASASIARDALESPSEGREEDDASMFTARIGRGRGDDVEATDADAGVGRGTRGAADEERANASVDAPAIAVVYGEDDDVEGRRRPAGSTASAREVESEIEGEVGVDAPGNGVERARGMPARLRAGGRGGPALSSSNARGPQWPANSAADSNTAAVSSDREQPADSTEAQRQSKSIGEGEAGRTESGLCNSEEVEGGDVKAAGSLLASERGAVGMEVESKQIILPSPTPWDNLEPWDVPRESLVEASLELKARADAFKKLENFGTAERAYGHALRFIDQIDMFESEEPSGLSERNSSLRLECLLQASACALQRADPVRAGELAARVLAREPNSALALKARAIAAVTEGDFGTAISDLTKALELHPQDTALKQDLADVISRRDMAVHAPRRTAIGASLMGPPGAVTWGTMPMSVVGGAASSAHGGKLYSYPNAGYVASGGLGMTHEVEGETDGAISAMAGGYGAFQGPGENNGAGINAQALLDGTNLLRRAESISHATGAGSRMDMPDMTFNRVGGTPSVSKGTAISFQKGALQSDAFMLGDESEEEGEEVCGGGSNTAKNVTDEHLDS